MYLKLPQRVDFDPSNKEHRQAAAAFMRRNAWGDSPIKFTHDPDYDNVANQVRVKMLHWYMANDFGRIEVAVPRTAITTKPIVLVADEVRPHYVEPKK